MTAHLFDHAFLFVDLRIIVGFLQSFFPKPVNFCGVHMRKYNVENIFIPVNRMALNVSFDILNSFR